jgi:hypothetical protein
MRNAALFCRRPRALGVVFTAFALAVVVGAGSAAASISHAGGKIQVIGANSGILGGGTGGGTSVITGAIGDNGTSGAVSKTGQPDANGHYVLLTLTHGTIMLDKTRLDSNVRHALKSLRFNSKTCSTTITASATLRVVRGTGGYKGISGNLHVTVTTGFVLPRYTRGAHSGQCNKSSTAQPTASLQTVDGTGRVKFS